jgi:hypothetical protein
MQLYLLPQSTSGRYRIRKQDKGISNGAWPILDTKSVRFGPFVPDRGHETGCLTILVRMGRVQTQRRDT